MVTTAEAVAVHPNDQTAVNEIGALNARGDIEIAEGSDTPTSEGYELRIVVALRPLVEERRDAAVRGLR